MVPERTQEAPQDRRLTSLRIAPRKEPQALGVRDVRSVPGTFLRLCMYLFIHLLCEQPVPVLVFRESVGIRHTKGLGGQCPWRMRGGRGSRSNKAAGVQGSADTWESRGGRREDWGKSLRLQCSLETPGSCSWGAPEPRLPMVTGKTNRKCRVGLELKDSSFHVFL